MSLGSVVSNNLIKNSSTVKKFTEDLFGKKDEGKKTYSNKIDSNLGLEPYGEKVYDDDQTITIVNDFIIEAVKLKASDIHIEPRSDGLKIRFRVDGSFVNYMDLQITQKDAIIARVKILSSLRIDEHRLPQDGKINYKFYGGKAIDMRISIIPTIYGEKCVIRLLKKDTKPPMLKDLGILPYNIQKVNEHLKDPYGMILVVGPTGSGKSTTLFSILSNFNPEEKNISTLEDPVEYRIHGVNHIQINNSINFSFATGLRSLLRQDPDIIMVGEIRDEETAKLAFEASITGHIVFSTLHTNSASHTIHRLINLGIDPILISSSLKMIVSQRLARKLCANCKTDYIANDEVKKLLIGRIGRYIVNKENIKLYKAKIGGCEKCNHTGYSGRIGLFEILEMTEKIESLMLRNASRIELEIQAIGEGMITIKDDGLIKVILGEVSLEEVISVVGN